MAPAMAAFLALVALFSGVQAAPNLNYDLMDQVPPVARVDQDYIFSLLPSTFNTTAGSITYTTSGMPSWLSFNSASVAFFGTPSSSDEGQEDITLTARDNDGTTDTSFTLIVTEYTQPQVHQGFVTQIANDSDAELASVQRLPGGTGISVPPYWSFSLGFLWETFRLSRTDPINGDLFFSARERGMTTLPSWLSFNNLTMTFGGVAPAEGTFTIVATGTDFWGYTGAQTSFIIEVGTGQGIELNRNTNFTDIVTMSREDVDYQVDVSNILVGGEAATADQVVLSLSGSEFPWLSIDSSNRITGKTPDIYQNGTVTPLVVPLTVASTNASNTLELVTYIGLDIVAYPFTVFNLPNVTATPGSGFEFDLSPYVRSNPVPSNVTVFAAASIPINSSVFPTEAAEWLTFHEGNLTLTGNAPKDPGYDHVEVEFTAGEGGNTASSTLTVNMEGVTNSPPTGGTTSLPSTTGTQSSGGGGGLSKGARIAIGVVFGLLGLILLILLLWFCCRRRRKNKEAEQKAMDDGDSFVVGSPAQDPFRRSNNPDQPRNLLGEFAKFSGFHLKSPEAEGPRSPEMLEKPHRLDGLRGIFGWGEQATTKKEEVILPAHSSHGSFRGEGDVISIRDPVERPSQSASSFDQTFGSSSDSRASWESRESFQWSSLENDDTIEGANNRLSTAPSIPRPREDFTPRYPRNNSPSRLAHLASQHTLNSPEFSEFHGSSGEDSLAHTLNSGTGSGSSGPSSGFTGANRFESNGAFRSIDEEDEGDHTDAEGPAIVSMAERQSFETRTPRQAESYATNGNRQSHSNFGALGPGGYRQSVADSAFDDADTTEVHGLGYPASSIFGSPGSEATRGVSMISSNPRSSYDPRSSTIRAIPELGPAIQSPPLPQVGSFAREIIRQPHPQMQHRPTSMTSDGRVIACANETFSMHPTINPPPRIALSAATWSSNPPSSYRAEVDGGGSLPTWLHFDARELELWGVPALANAGDVTALKIVEILPRDKRRSDPSQFGYEPAQERIVGRVIVEVVDRFKSPQFALENSPHAF